MRRDVERFGGCVQWETSFEEQRGMMCVGPACTPETQTATSRQSAKLQVGRRVVDKGDWKLRWIELMTCRCFNESGTQLGIWDRWYPMGGRPREESIGCTSSPEGIAPSKFNAIPKFNYLRSKYIQSSSQYSTLGLQKPLGTISSASSILGLCRNLCPSTISSSRIPYPLQESMPSA